MPFMCVCDPSAKPATPRRGFVALDDVDAWRDSLDSDAYRMLIEAESRAAENAMKAVMLAAGLTELPVSADTLGAAKDCTLTLTPARESLDLTLRLTRP